ncbi:type IV secretion protein Rhs, partial [Klebsiella pneumoniae]
LYFGPKPDPKATPYVLMWQEPNADQVFPEGNFMDLRFTRGLTVSRGIQVVVRSFNSKGKKSYAATYPSKGNTTQAGKAKPFGGT